MPHAQYTPALSRSAVPRQNSDTSPKILPLLARMTQLEVLHLRACQVHTLPLLLHLKHLALTQLEQPPGVEAMACIAALPSLETLRIAGNGR